MILGKAFGPPRLMLKVNYLGGKSFRPASPNVEGKLFGIKYLGNDLDQGHFAFPRQSFTKYAKWKNQQSKTLMQYKLFRRYGMWTGKSLPILGLLFTSVLCYGPRVCRHSVLRTKTSLNTTHFPSPGREYISNFLDSFCSR